MEDLDAPIALRRPRRSNVGVAEQEDTKPAPKTPRRQKKTVRFSDPGPALTNNIETSSGLTPMIRRTSIATPRRRHTSTPARASRSGTPASQGSTLFPNAQHSSHALHQTADGRIERRIRRNNLRELLNKLELQKKRSAKLARSEIDHLKSEVKARDREIYELQNATVVIDTERIWDLEQQIEDLKDELDKRLATTPQSQGRSYNWTLAARDPFADDYTDMDMDTELDEDHFGDATMAHFATSTPSKTKSSFLTPPATSPPMPATPCSRAYELTPMSHAGVQVCFPDPAKQQLEEELASLQLEVCKLTTTLDSYKDLGGRIARRLLSVAPASAEDASHASPLEALERQVEVLAQSMSDRTVALTQLNASITDLGFPGNDAGEMMTALASGFRAARLELEYLTPGELALPLTSHGAEVLDLLLTRLRVLAKKSQEDETTIDEYHEIEQSLRTQLDARVSVMDGLKAEMSKAERLMNEKNIKIQELQVGNDRLKGAVDGYIRDISELEKLVERLDQDGKDAAAAHQTQAQSQRDALAAKDAGASELEARLADAMQRTTSLQQELSDVQDSTTRHVVSLNKKHGAALALRDARVLELRGEIDRVNESLRAAHETIRGLRVDNSGLAAQAADDRHKAKTAMDAMKAELQRVLQMSQAFLDSPERGASRAERDDDAEDTGYGGSSPPVRGTPVRRPGGFLASDLARRGSKTTRRRYDSGMGLLTEDEVDI
ncbi:hypothetical protein TOPH_08557 [Tolypocladium ophioglossoides CBS 100239]|uniref:Uncharacterized protein n=1 Tax=Tolypocladium ophioglossoides (strain CBS 100239) TaxID=1163406 RepID=A0A0L0MY51_TOLOC|nr:hypothetical protein TOPH_08557 [Tolypocladium ophioglossoides CBS 100239]